MGIVKDDDDEMVPPTNRNDPLGLLINVFGDAADDDASGMISNVAGDTVSLVSEAAGPRVFTRGDTKYKISVTTGAHVFTGEEPVVKKTKNRAAVTTIPADDDEF